MIVTDNMITEITQEVELVTSNTIKDLDIAERFGKRSSTYLGLLKLKLLSNSLNTPIPIENELKLIYYNKIKEILHKLNIKKWTVC